MQPSNGQRFGTFSGESKKGIATKKNHTIQRNLNCTPRRNQANQKQNVITFNTHRLN